MLESERPDVQRFFPSITGLIHDAVQLYQFPLFYTHFDLNLMNFLVQDDGEVSGIVDWELAYGPLPFGILCSSIHFPAGVIINGRHHERHSFDAMEMGFWNEIVNGGPPQAKMAIEAN